MVRAAGGESRNKAVPRFLAAGWLRAGRVVRAVRNVRLRSARAKIGAARRRFFAAPWGRRNKASRCLGFRFRRIVPLAALLVALALLAAAVAFATSLPAAVLILAPVVFLRAPVVDSVVLGVLVVALAA
eukprot:15221879-Alexandrium_andersonii.AAC.1